MNDVDVLESLYDALKKIDRNDFDEINKFLKKTEMLIRKIFSVDSNYLINLKEIKDDYRDIEGSGKSKNQQLAVNLRRLDLLVKTIKDERIQDTNYQNAEIDKFIKRAKLPNPLNKMIKEIKVLIASPGDVRVEREILLDKLETKFRRNNFEEYCGARIIVQGWESVPSQSGYPQDIINNDLVQNSNIVLAIFRHKLGSPTIDIKTGKNRSQSGTAEELLFAIRNKLMPTPPIGMAYFYEHAPIISLDSIDFENKKKEWDRLKQFKDEIQNEILYKTYKREEDIIDMVCKDLSENIKKYFN
jgi:hypothetical protein